MTSHETTANVMTELDLWLKEVWMPANVRELFQRAHDQIVALQTTLAEVAELIDGYVDIRDGANGPLPNDAMKAHQLIREALNS